MYEPLPGPVQLPAHALSFLLQAQRMDVPLPASQKPYAQTSAFPHTRGLQDQEPSNMKESSATATLLPQCYAFLCYFLAPSVDRHKTFLSNQPPLT